MRVAWQCETDPFCRQYSPVTGLTSPATPTSESSEEATSNPSMSSAADSPAKTSATPAGARDRRRTLGSLVASTPDSLASYDPATSSWRTSQLSLLEDSSVFLETWPRSGMTRNGTAYRLRPLAPLTDATGSGSWPTRDSAGLQGPAIRTAAEKRSARACSGWHGTVPTAMGRKRRQDGRALAGDQRRGGTHARRTAAGSDDLEERVAARRTAGGSLNPTWVEWLMGFPLGWTDCGASVTRSSRRSRNGSESGDGWEAACA